MTPVEWTAILALVGGAVDLAIRVVEVLRSSGCPVHGCPAEVEARLLPGDVPTGENQLAARARIRAGR